MLTLGTGIVLGLVLAGLTQLSAQNREIASIPSAVGRFQMAAYDRGSLLILDTVTGTIYTSDNTDWSEYKDRPKVAVPRVIPKDEKKDDKTDTKKDEKKKLDLKFTPDELKKLLDDGK